MDWIASSPSFTKSTWHINCRKIRKTCRKTDEKRQFYDLHEFLWSFRISPLGHPLAVPYVPWTNDDKCIYTYLHPISKAVKSCSPSHPLPPLWVVVSAPKSPKYQLGRRPIFGGIKGATKLGSCLIFTF